jgi:hypothetical protein
MKGLTLLMDRLRLQCTLYAATRIAYEERERIARSPESQPDRVPRYTYTITLPRR